MAHGTAMTGKSLPGSGKEDKQVKVWQLESGKKEVGKGEHLPDF